MLAGRLLCCLALVWWIVRVTLLAPGARGEASGYGQFVLAAVGLLIGGRRGDVEVGSSPRP